VTRKKAKGREKEQEQPTRKGIPESIKQKKRLGKKADFSDYFDLKVEVAEELGLLEKVKKHGWGSLSLKESGRLGGYMTRRLRQQEAHDADRE